MKTKYYICLSIFISLLFISLLATDAQTKENQGLIRIQKNIKMMEKILDTSLSEYDGDVLPINGVYTSGMFIPGYGVMFTVAPNFNPNILVNMFTKYDNYSSPLPMNKSQRDKREKEREKKREEILLKLTDPIIEFMTDYAVTLKGLNPTDKVTVICELPKEYRDTIQKMYGKGSKIIFSADIKWLTDYRKEQINYNELKTKIINRLKNLMPEKDTIKRMSIFESILGAQLEEMIEENISTRNISGTYIKGFGAVFSIDVRKMGFFNGSFNFVADNIEINKSIKEQEIIIKGNLEKLQNLEILRKSKDNLSGQRKILEKKRSEIEVEKKQAKENKKKLEEEILSTLTNCIAEVTGDFGLTLRELKDNERIEILLKSARLGSRERKDVQFTINKKDITDYNKDLINLETFKNRIGVKVF